MAYCSALVHVDFLQGGHVDREDPLHAHGSAHLADGKGFGGPRAAALDHNAPEKLGTCLFTFLDFVVDRNGVAGREFREILFAYEFVFNKTY